MLAMKVRVVQHDPGWSAAFMAEADRIRLALRDVVVAIHHIGSTAIAGIFSKPIIDILLEVDDLQTLDSHSSALTELRYEAKGEFGIPGRRYFRKDSVTGERAHQIHAFQRGSPALERHLAFRDYLIAHPSVAQSYSLLKQRLAASHPDDIEAYMNGKDLFIKEHEAKAIVWKNEAR
jgi:GrpB-like predicted nucleotidyltransferase (UPF0157 family)